MAEESHDIVTETASPDKGALRKPTSSSPGVIVLQWLTYAFWGWTTLALIWLAIVVLMQLLAGENTIDMIPYAIASTVVLLPLSLLCDFFYRRKEPAQKTGGAMVVMVIHAVIFALCGIGSLIALVLTIVQFSIGETDSVASMHVSLGVAVIAGVAYGCLFLRTLNPFPSLHFPAVTSVIMTILAGGFIVYGFIGPVTQARLTKDDRDIDASIDTIRSGVESYVSNHRVLPESLRSIRVKQCK